MMFLFFRLGTSFDIRDFHYTILSNGPVPLDVLEKIINDWIQSKMTQTSSKPPSGPLHVTCDPAGTVNYACNIQSNVYMILTLVLLISMKVS